MGKRKHRSRSRSRSGSRSRRRSVDQDQLLHRLERLERALKTVISRPASPRGSSVRSQSDVQSTKRRRMASSERVHTCGSRSDSYRSCACSRRSHARSGGIRSSSSRSPPLSPQKNSYLRADNSPVVGSFSEPLELDQESRVQPGHSDHKVESDEDVLLLHDDSMVNSEFLDLIGKDPEANSVKIELLPELVKRWSHFLHNGLDKTQLKEILDKYPAPGNFLDLNPPVLNEEIAQIIAPTSLKRDKYQCHSQDQLKSGITAVGCALNLLLKDGSDLGKLLLPVLTDAGKVLLNLYFTMSLNRKHLLVPQLNKNIKQIAMESKTDVKLFGEDFSDKCKTVKDLEKSARDLKPCVANEPRKVAHLSKKPVSDNLNWKGLPQNKRVMRNYRPNPQRKKYSHH